MRLTQMILFAGFSTVLFCACEEPSEIGSDNQESMDVEQSKLQISLRTWARDMNVPGFSDQPISSTFNISSSTNTSIYYWLRAVPDNGSPDGAYSCDVTSPDPQGRDLYVGIQKWNNASNSWNPIPTNWMWTLCSTAPEMVYIPYDGSYMRENEILLQLGGGSYRLVAHFPDGKEGKLGEWMTYISVSY